MSRLILYYMYAAGLAVAGLNISCENKTGVASEQLSAESEEDFSNYALIPIEGGLQMAERIDGSGSVFERGFVLDNQKHGQWVKYNNEGDISEITPWLNGEIYGSVMTFNRRMQVEKISTMVGGQLEGPFVEYDNGRLIQKLSYRNGKLDGIQRFYFESGAEKGKIQRAVEYHDGVIDGFMRYYDPEGKVTLEYQYENGERVGGGMIE